MKYMMILMLVISSFFLSLHVDRPLFGLWQNKEKADFSAYSEKIPGSDQSIKMVPVPGGTFLMGSPQSEPHRSKDEGPQHKVKVDPFWMGAYEITWDQFELFLRDEVDDLLNKKLDVNGKELKVDAITSPTPEYIDMSFGMGREGGYPVVNITNYAAVMFAKWLFLKTGHFYRLPTEAEWE